MLRPLVMDFRGDPRARGIVRSVHVRAGVAGRADHGAQAHDRGSVYLPPSGVWYDFWTGARRRGDGPGDRERAARRDPRVSCAADRSCRRARSRQYTSEKPSRSDHALGLRGRERSFELYEDDGTTNAYERGAFAAIPLRGTTPANADHRRAQGELQRDAEVADVPGDAGRGGPPCAKSRCGTTGRRWSWHSSRPVVLHSQSATITVTLSGPPAVRAA